MKNVTKVPFPDNLCEDIVQRTHLAQRIDPEMVLNALEQLNNNHKQTLLMHYKEGKTLTEISRIYAVTPERIRQVRNHELWELRRIIFRSGITTLRKSQTGGTVK